MSLFRPRYRRRATAAAALMAAFMTLDTALASQGPGTGPGTAGPATQLVVAVLVYGSSAAIVVAAMIGMWMRRS
jgi:hypothetical protein